MNSCPLLRCTLAVSAAIAVFNCARADEPNLLTVDRIYQSGEFNEQRFSARWLDDGGYSTLEPSKDADGRDIVRHDPRTGKSRVLVSASELIPAGGSAPLKIEDHAWSANRARLLIYTNSKRVWRRNTRGDYWVLDRASRQLRKLGGDAPPASLMFAKFSPDGLSVGYVRDRNVYIEDLRSRAIGQLTETPTDDIINGTTDWVYEEEFGLRDGFRFSPDGKSIAYWQLDTTSVPKFPLVNNIDSLYPKVQWFAYPKVGQRNPHCRVGVVDIKTAKTRWTELPGDPARHYIPRIEWAGESNDLLLQQLNRLQNTNRLFLVDTAGQPNNILTERDDAWVDVHDELKWFAKGRQFTWISERDGWRHAYIARRDGGEPRLATPGDFDVMRLLHVDQQRGVLYFIASPKTPTQRYLFRAALDGSQVDRLTPADQSGSHRYQISPDGRWALHDWSNANRPTQSELVSLPDHRRRKQLVTNEKLVEKIADLPRQDTEFFRVAIADGVELDAWCVKPPRFDPQTKYPLLVYVYGEPAGSTVNDRWGGKSYLWHLMLAQRGYVVMSFDNRGANVARGRAWRKKAYRKIGIVAPQDQAAAVRAVLKERSYLDADRVGIWGWSGGGSSSLHAIFKYPKLYKTAIAIAPVPNQRYYDTIYQERYMGLPETNVEGFRQGSPINFAKNLEGDLLLVHGTADDNCHYQTTELLIDELVAHNKQFMLMSYPNRTHSIRERKNTTRHLREMMTRFLLQHLPPGPRM